MQGTKVVRAGVMIVARMLERIRESFDVDRMQFGFVSGRGMTDAFLS